MVRPERFELPASWFVARRSIQLSYGRARGANITTPTSECHSIANWRRARAADLWSGGERGITRRCAPRPFGAALAGVIPALSLPRLGDRHRREFM